MEQNDPNPSTRITFAGEKAHRVQPLNTAEVELDNSDNPGSHLDAEPVVVLSSSVDTHMANAPGAQSVSLGNSGTVQQPKVQTAFIHKLYK